MVEIVIYSIIIGAIGGACIAAGASRMFHAPEIQSMGSFRTLGEMNACGGDPVAHFSGSVLIPVGRPITPQPLKASSSACWHRRS